MAGSLLVTACGPPPRPPAICKATLPPAAPVQAVVPWQCGPTLDFTPVNQYEGEFAAVMDREDAVVLIDGRCTGTWIQASAGPVVLTAGHCVALGDRAVIAFNHEENPDGESLVTEGSVVEHSSEPDYALIQLDAIPTTEPLRLTSRFDERLAIIQHPRGLPKVIAEGRIEGSCNDLVYYSDLDTLVGSSGAGVLTRAGDLLGIHTDGDCAESGLGTNRGWTSERIVEVSSHLVAEDLVP